MGQHSISDDWMNIGFPGRDFDGYSLFGAIRGSGEFEAIKLITLLGGVGAFDWGWKNLPPDLDYCFYEIRLIGEKRTVGHVAEPHRHEFRYSRDKLDLRLGDQVRLSGSWPNMSWALASADGTLSVAIEAKAQSVHWSPTLVHRETAWVTYAHLDFEYEGLAVVEGVHHDISGIGTFDRPMGRIHHSSRSPGIGYWQWDGLMLDDKFGLFHWHIVDGDGNVLLSEGATNYPDYVFKTGKLDFAYREFEPRGNISRPTRWDCALITDVGTLRYDVQAVGETWDGTVAPLGTGLPNPLLRVRGVFEGSGTRAPSRSFVGKGTGESVQCLWNPATNTPSRPW
jgi:hypothetical protein